MQKLQRIKVNPPTVSVLMVVYNAEKYLVEAIDSIINQTWPNWELIIVDDGSTDGTAEILIKYRKNSDKVFVYSNPQNQGIIYSRNLALSKAQGKYVAVLDADDVALPNRLKIQAEFLDHNSDVFLISSDAVIIDENSRELRKEKFQISPERVAKNIIKDRTPIHSTVMFRNTKEYLYREKALHCEDLDLYLQMLADKKILDSIPECLTMYRLSDNSDSTINASKQKVFSIAFRNWYRNKVKYEVDIYDKLDVNELLREAERKNTDRFSLMIRIQRKFALNRMKEVRKLCRDYWKKYKLDKRTLKYFSLSIMPLFLVDLLREIK